MPKVSVIVPVYNAEKFLVSALECLKNQTYTDFEAVCINDGSTDSSLSILEKYAKEDNRFKVFSQANSGQSGGRNTGLDKALGNYIMFMDNDDLMHPQAIECLVSQTTLNDIDIVCHGHRRICENGTMGEHKELEKLEKGKIIDPFFGVCSKKISIMPWSKLYKKSLFQGFRFPKVPLGEDYYTTCILFSKASRVSVLEHRFYFHRQFATSQSGTITPAKAQSVFGVAQSLFNYFKQTPLTPIKLKAFKKYTARYQLYGTLISAIKGGNLDVLKIIQTCWNDQSNVSFQNLTIGKRFVMRLIAQDKIDQAVRLYSLLEKIKI